jgi:hypothetical protein
VGVQSEGKGEGKEDDTQKTVHGWSLKGLNLGGKFLFGPRGTLV